MANFRAYPGLYVRCIQSLKSLDGKSELKVGSIYQIVKVSTLLSRYFLFAFNEGKYWDKYMGKYIEPVYDYIPKVNNENKETV